MEVRSFCQRHCRNLETPWRSLPRQKAIAIAWPTKSSQELVGMRLQNDCPGANDFSPLASRISWCADGIESPMGEGQRLGLGKRTLAGYRPRSIYIDEQRGLPCSIRQAAWGCKRLAIQQILLKERTQCFHGSLIEGEPRKRERVERWGKRWRPKRAMKGSVSFSVNIWPCTRNIWLFRKYLAGS